MEFLTHLHSANCSFISLIIFPMSQLLTCLECLQCRPTAQIQTQGMLDVKMMLSMPFIIVLVMQLICNWLLAFHFHVKRVQTSPSDVYNLSFRFLSAILGLFVFKQINRAVTVVTHWPLPFYYVVLFFNDCCVSFSEATKVISIQGVTLTQQVLELHTIPPRTQFPQWVGIIFINASPTLAWFVRLKSHQFFLNFLLHTD